MTFQLIWHPWFVIEALAFGCMVLSRDLYTNLHVHWSVCVAYSLVVGGFWECRGSETPHHSSGRSLFQRQWILEMLMLEPGEGVLTLKRSTGMCCP